MKLHWRYRLMMLPWRIETWVWWKLPKLTRRRLAIQWMGEESTNVAPERTLDEITIADLVG